MKLKFCFVWFVALILSLLYDTLSADDVQQHRNCFSQCMDYCTNEGESGIPSFLCQSVCTSMCYSTARIIGATDGNWQHGE